MTSVAFGSQQIGSRKRVCRVEDLSIQLLSLAHDLLERALYECDINKWCRRGALARNAAITSSGRPAQIQLHAITRNAGVRKVFRLDSLKNVERSGICHSITGRFIPVSGKAWEIRGDLIPPERPPAAVTIGK